MGRGVPENRVLPLTSIEVDALSPWEYLTAAASRVERAWQRYATACKEPSSVLVRVGLAEIESGTRVASQIRHIKVSGALRGDLNADEICARVLRTYCYNAEEAIIRMHLQKNDFEGFSKEEADKLRALMKDPEYEGLLRLLRHQLRRYDAMWPHLGVILKSPNKV